jgi:hypothetical protein
MYISAIPLHPLIKYGLINLIKKHVILTDNNKSLYNTLGDWLKKF